MDGRWININAIMFNHFHFILNLLRAHLTVHAWVDHLPGLRVHIVAMQLIGQSVVCSTSKDIEVAVKGHHGVAIPSLGRWRRAPK